MLAGSYGTVPGAMDGEHVKVLYLDVEVAPGVEWVLETDPEETLFVYIVEGEGTFGAGAPGTIPARHALLFDKGRQFRLRASGGGIRFLLLSAKPLGEPIAWGGPIVMNTRRELDTAFRELNEGTFIKH